MTAMLLLQHGGYGAGGAGADARGASDGGGGFSGGKGGSTYESDGASKNRQGGTSFVYAGLDLIAFNPPTNAGDGIVIITRML